MAVTTPAVLILPPVMLLVTDTVVPVTLPTSVPSKFPPAMLAVDVMFPVAVTCPVVSKLPTVTLPTVLLVVKIVILLACTLPEYVGKKAATLELPYISGRPSSSAPLPKK